MVSYDQPAPREWEANVEAECENEKCPYLEKNGEPFKWTGHAHMTEHFGCELDEPDCPHCDSPLGDCSEVDGADGREPYGPRGPLHDTREEQRGER